MITVTFYSVLTVVRSAQFRVHSLSQSILSVCPPAPPCPSSPPIPLPPRGRDQLADVDRHIAAVEPLRFVLFVSLLVALRL